MAEEEEPPRLAGAVVRLADVNRDGRLDIICQQDGALPTANGDQGGWNIYLNRR